MFELIVIITMIIGVVLIGAVLIQPSKGDLTAGFGGVGGQLGSMFGMRKATDLLTKITIGLAAAILLLSIAANKFLPDTGTHIAPVTQGADAPTPPATQSQPPSVPQKQQGQGGQNVQPQHK